MKFKENAIKPGMAIHCPKKEDARELLKYLDNRGYIWEDTFDSLLNNTRYEEGDTYFLDYDKKDNEYRVTHDSYDWAIENGYAPTEFSDLIEPDEPQMSAVEVLDWLIHSSTGEIKEIFGECYNRYYEVLEIYDPQTVIDKITAYEAAKKAQKPVEVEWVDICRIIQIQDNGFKKCVYEEELPDNDGYATTENILKKYISEHEGQYIAVMEGVCRAKEDK